MYVLNLLENVAAGRVYGSFDKLITPGTQQELPCGIILKCYENYSFSYWDKKSSSSAEAMKKIYTAGDRFSTSHSLFSSFIAFDLYVDKKLGGLVCKGNYYTE